jgi:hypothetical protein
MIDLDHIVEVNHMYFIGMVAADCSMEVVIRIKQRLEKIFWRETSTRNRGTVV